MFDHHVVFIRERNVRRSIRRWVWGWGTFQLAALLVQQMIKKLSTENNELYGSVKPTEISKLILELEKIDIKPSMIQPVKEIKALGKFAVKVFLHSEVDAELTINVETSENIQ